MEMLQPFSILLWIAALMCFILYGVNTEALGAKSNLWLGSYNIDKSSHHIGWYHSFNRYYHLQSKC